MGAELEGWAQGAAEAEGRSRRLQALEADAGLRVCVRACRGVQGPAAQCWRIIWLLGGGSLWSEVCLHWKTKKVGGRDGDTPKLSGCGGLCGKKA